MQLTTTQSEEARKVKAGGQYAKSAWRAVIDRVIEGKVDEGFIEQEFPLVKPAHVRHCLRLELKAAAESGDELPVSLGGLKNPCGVVLLYEGEDAEDEETDES